MKRMNRIICVTVSVLVLICIASLTVFGANTVIDDRSGFLFESEKNECMDIIKEVSAKYNINIHIVQCDVVFSGAVNSIEQEKRALWYALHTDGVSKAYSFLHVLR